MPLVNASESGIAIRSERQRVTETYSYGEEEIHLNNSALIWALHNIRRDRLLTVGELGKAAAKARTAAEVRESETMKTFCIGQKDSCKKYYKQRITNSEKLADASSCHLREIRAALKSRPMKRTMQKRKYETAPSILGQHKGRSELENRTERLNIY